MFETTRIGEGTKIDNLVMIGHNNQIGRHNLLCGQVGIAGSCKTGDYVVMAGQAGIKDKTQIGDKVVVGAQAGVHRNIPDGQTVLGSPAVPVREQRRLFQMIARLPEMHRQLRELTGQIEALTALVAQGSDARTGVAIGDGVISAAAPIDAEKARIVSGVPDGTQAENC
jgi:UDP-3-O-[3-hydroxymyristoyl] glucosamine N-acyltransferase